MTDENDPLADEEAEEAPAGAAAQGGRPTRDLEEDLPPDPAMDPVYEAGGGESEGWEMAEEELLAHAAHGPARPRVEVRVREEVDRGTEEEQRGIYGEPDEEDVTEVRY